MMALALAGALGWVQAPARADPPVQMADNGDFASGDLGPWSIDIGFNTGHPSPIWAVETVDGAPDALHISRPADTDGSHAIASLPIDADVLAGTQLTLSFDVRIDSHNFGNYGSWNVYPANVWLEYLDEQGNTYTLRRSFYTMVGPGHTPDAPPLAEQITAGVWESRAYDLAGLAPAATRIVEIRVGSQGWSYDVAFDNVLLDMQPSCTTARDDDGAREDFASIDYDDDFMEKTIALVDDPATSGGGRLWIHGQPYNYAGQSFQPRDDYHLQVNGDPLQEIVFDVGALFDQRDDIYQWVVIDVPAAWLTLGDNTFYLFEQSPFGAWDHNNLRVGVDTDTDLDASWSCGNGLFPCFDPTVRTGELMIFLELCALGDLDRDGFVGIIDLLALLAAWGPCPAQGDCPADLDGDGQVGIVDLLALLANWGA
jgi:hypothetical protein